MRTMFARLYSIALVSKDADIVIALNLIPRIHLKIGEEENKAKRLSLSLGTLCWGSSPFWRGKSMQPNPTAPPIDGEAE